MAENYRVALTASMSNRFAQGTRPEGFLKPAFFLSPLLYGYVSIFKEDKRTDYPGKEIALKTQYAWDQQFETNINVVLGNEWNAGNLSYHLKSRPVWEGFVTRDKLDELNDYMCLDNVCVGSK